MADDKKRAAYDPSVHPGQAQRLAEMGAVDREIADFFGIPCSTFYNWRNAHAEFCTALATGKEMADVRVERALYNRAIGYSYDAVKIVTVSLGDNGGSEVVQVPYVEHVPPDVKAAVRWLESRQPKVWRRSLSLTGPGGGPIETSNTDFSDLNEDERAQLRQLLSRSAAEPGEGAR